MTPESGVARFEAGAVRPRGAPSTGAPARSLDRADWSGQVLSLADLRLDLPDLGGEVVAEMFRVADGVIRRGTTYLRRKIGWRAQRGGIILVQVEQPLRPRSDGKFAPAGPWQDATTTVYRATTDPMRRTGDVAVDENTDRGQGESVRPQADTPVSFRDAAANLAYLPETVRAGLTQQVPAPWLMEAEAIRYTRPDGSIYHRVVGLLLGSTRAVVVSASRQAIGPTWQVEQVGYELGAPFPGGADRVLVGESP